MTLKKFAVSLVCLAGLVGMVGVAALAPPSVSAQADASSSAAYVIQPNDVLTVFVYNHPELSLDVLVQPDGMISTPLAQSIKAGGLSADALKKSVEDKLDEVIDIPNVTIIIKAIQSYRIFVIGKVQKPGLLTYEKPITVLQALALAGGFQDYAKKKEITITRTIPQQGVSLQQEIRYNFNYEEVIKGIDQLQNRFLISGDVISVQ